MMANGTRMSIQGKDRSISKGLDVRMWKEWDDKFEPWVSGWWAGRGQCKEPSQETERVVVLSTRHLSLDSGWKESRQSKGGWMEPLQCRPVARRWRTVARPLCSPRNLKKYWVGQKVHLSFSVRGYRKAWMNFVANPLFDGTSVL